MFSGGTNEQIIEQKIKYLRNTYTHGGSKSIGQGREKNHTIFKGRMKGNTFTISLSVWIMVDPGVARESSFLTKYQP